MSIHNTQRAIGPQQRTNLRRWKGTQILTSYKNTLRNLCGEDGMVNLTRMAVLDGWWRTLQNNIHFKYLIRTNFRGHLISRIWTTKISRALIFAILQKMMNLGRLISLISAFRDGLLTQSLVIYPERYLGLHLCVCFFKEEGLHFCLCWHCVSDVIFR